MNLVRGFETDLDMFRSEIVTQDPSYSPVQRTKALQTLANVERGLSKASLASLHLSLAKITAMAGNGHTSLLNTNWQNLFQRIPVRFLFLSSGLYVGHASNTWKHLEDHQVLSINGFSVNELESRWAVYQGGQAGWRKQFIYHFLEAPELLASAGVGNNPDRIELACRDGAGKTKNVTIKAQPLAVEFDGIEEFIPPPRLQLVYKLRDVKAPYYLSEPEEPFRYRTLEKNKIAYLQFRTNIDFSGKRDIVQFAADVEESLRQDRPVHLIVDQRLNWGGDLTTTRALMERLPSFVSGQVFLLTSGRTFSAGISSSAYLKQAGGDQVTILGEPVGDDLEFWAEGDLLNLPTLQANLLYARERHNYRTGCPEADCHANIQHNPIRIKTLAPDVPVSPSQDDFLAGRDPVIEKVLDITKVI
jgi:hypothetical protein